MDPTPYDKNGMEITRADLLRLAAIGMEQIRDAATRESVDRGLRPGAALIDLEPALQRTIGLLGARVLQAEMQERADATTPPSLKESPCPVCGRLAAWHGLRPRTLQSTIGVVQFKRAVFWCKGCRKVFAPADAVLGLEPSLKQTPWMRQLESEFGSQAVSFESGRRLMGRTVVAPHSNETIQRAIATEAEAILAESAELEEQARRNPGGVELWPCAATAEDTLIIEPDGGMTPCRPQLAAPGATVAAPEEPVESSIPLTRQALEEQSERKKKRPMTQHREAKAVKIYRACDRIEKPPAADADPSVPGRAHLRRSFCLTRIAHWSVLAWALFGLLLRLGLRRAKRVVVLGDGAKWIDDLVAEFLPNAIRILDFWHVVEHLAAPAKLLFGADTDGLRVQRLALRNGHLDTVLAALRNLPLTTGLSAAARSALGKAVEEVVKDLEPRRAQMNYPRFEALGLPIASGAIEGHINHEIKGRGDGHGRRWNPQGAQNVFVVRDHAANQAALAA